MFGTAEKLKSQLQMLLAAEQYEAMALRLDEVSQDFIQEGNAGSAAILSATAQVCYACHRLRQQLAIYQRTHQELIAQEAIMKEQLQRLLQMAHDFGPETAVFLPTPPAPLPVEQATAKTKLSQRLPGWLKKLVGAQPQISSELDKDTASRIFMAVTPVRDEEKIAELPATPPNDSTRIEPQSLEPLEPVERLGFSQQLPANLPESTQELIIYCLGAFRVYDDTRAIVDWNGLKSQLIFKYLITSQGTPVVKDKLMEQFWPDTEPQTARRNLHQAIYSLRRTLKSDGQDFQPILFEHDCYLLNPRLKIWVDYREFEHHVRNGRQLEQAGKQAAAMAQYGIAEGLYQGELFMEDLYEEWLQYKRELLRQEYVDITDRLSNYYLQQKEYTAAVAICQKLLIQDNCHEAAHRRLMHCYLARNQRHLAVRQYQECCEILRAELGVVPSRETEALFQSLKGR